MAVKKIIRKWKKKTQNTKEEEQERITWERTDGQLLPM